jgi:hypothetical protein
MGFFSGRRVWEATPGSTEMGNRYRQYGEGQTLGMAGKMAKAGLKQMSLGGGPGGYDSGIIGNMLAPIRDQFATQSREAQRNAGMGLGAIAGGVQPGLLARQQGLLQDQIGEQMGLSLSSAVPQIYGQLSNTFQNAQNSRRNAEEFGLQGEQSTLGMGQWRQEPSFLDKLGQITGIASQIGGMAMGMPGLGGGGAALPKGQTSTMGLWRANPSR